MKVLNYGSLNVDITYHVEHIVKEGETVSSLAVGTNAGGKGANQSAALAKAGVGVFHAGKIGRDGVFVSELLSGYGADVGFISVTDDQESGKAVIQVDRQGKNCIILHPGDNRRNTRAEMDRVLSHFDKGDYLILQNEINDVGYLMERAHGKGMRICINPSPIDDEAAALPLYLADLVFVNEIEGAYLAGLDPGAGYGQIAAALGERFPETAVLLTVGRNGSYHIRGGEVVHQGIIDYPVVDTTAAGDTFMGYFIASMLKGLPVEQCLFFASKASGIAVSRKGAMQSIPFADEVFV